tara:strand:- start:2457 stop:2798 length:342 start_codon:yes stop_codon:yes gene_type:complete
MIDGLIWFCCFSFFFYGLTCLSSKLMVLEFKRYGIPQYRKLTGWLQLAGACGMLLGFWIPYLQILSAIGLSVLMLFGIITRLLIKDSLAKTFPALFYCLLNGYLCYELIRTRL